MKNTEIILLIVALLLGGWIINLKNNPNLAGWGGDDTYLVIAPTQASTTITTTIKLLVAVNTARDNFVFTPTKDTYIWMANATDTTMVNNANGNSNGIFVASSTEWNMQDYGVIWPGKIYAIASSTAGIAVYTDYTKN